MVFCHRPTIQTHLFPTPRRPTSVTCRGGSHKVLAPPPESSLPHDGGRHRPLYQPFPLDVFPTAITFVNLTDLLFPQGQTTVPATNTHLSAVNDGRTPHITPKVTRWGGQRGACLWKTSWASLAQEDLGVGRLSCHLTDVPASRDQLQFSLFPSDTSPMGWTRGIQVWPLLWTRSVQPGRCQQSSLSLRGQGLGETELTNRTHSDPRFEVSEPPVHGRLVRRVGPGAVTKTHPAHSERP